MLSTSTALRRRTRHRRRGAVLLEFAILTPFLFTLAFGVAEFGYQWVVGNRVASAVATAARVASSSGSSTDADRNVLLSLKSALPDSVLANVERVVIYRSNAAGDIAPGCLTVGAGSGQSGSGVNYNADRCNTYNGNQLRNITATFSLGTSPNFWPACHRRDRLASTVRPGCAPSGFVPSPPDYIGVLVVTSSPSLTQTFWGDIELERRSVYRIAPDIDG